MIDPSELIEIHIGKMTFIYLLYIDPGNGALLLQIVVAAGTGALFYFGKIWTRVKRIFLREGPRRNDQ